MGERRWVPDLDEHGPREAWVPATVSEMHVSPRKRTDGRTASSVRFRAADGRELLFDSEKAKLYPAVVESTITHIMDDLVDDLEEEHFVWLGFICNKKPNRDDTK